MAWMAALWLCSVVAHAEPFYVETEAYADRDVAHAARDLLTGLQAPPVVIRRFERDDGWRYFVRVELAAGEPAARALAATVGERLSVDVRLYERLGRDLRRLPLVEAAPATPAAAPAAPVAVPTPSRSPPVAHRATKAADPGPSSPDTILRRVARAHGGAHEQAANDSILFRFERLLPSGSRVRHTYARRGQDLYVEVTPVEGAGLTASRSGVVDGKAWLAGYDGGGLNVARVREQLQRFSPEQVIALPLSLTAGFGGRELARMHQAEDAEVGGRACLQLAYDGDRAAEPLAIAIDKEAFLIRRVDVGLPGARLTREYSDYRELETGGVHPGSVVAREGRDVVDTVEVVQLLMDVSLPDEWFSPDGR